MWWLHLRLTLLTLRTGEKPSTLSNQQRREIGPNKSCKKICTWNCTFLLHYNPWNLNMQSLYWIICEAEFLANTQQLLKKKQASTENINCQIFKIKAKYIEGSDILSLVYNCYCRLESIVSPLYIFSGLFCLLPNQGSPSNNHLK